MNDVFPILLVTVLGAVLVAASSVGLSRRERKWVTVSFFMHVGFACAQVPLTLSFFGGGDMFLYFSYGEILARMMERDPLHVVPEVTALLAAQPTSSPASDHRRRNRHGHDVGIGRLDVLSPRPLQVRRLRRLRDVVAVRKDRDVPRLSSKRRSGVPLARGDRSTLRAVIRVLVFRLDQRGGRRGRVRLDVSSVFIFGFRRAVRFLEGRS